MNFETAVFVNKIKTSIIKNYVGFPLDAESENPNFQLNQYNKDIQESSWFEAQKYSNDFISTVSNLECFTYRAVNIENGADCYWNPLLESFSSFKNEHTVVYQSDTSYPTPDMIFTWCMRQKS